MLNLPRIGRSATGCLTPIFHIALLRNIPQDEIARLNGKQRPILPAGAELIMRVPRLSQRKGISLLDSTTPPNMERRTFYQ